MRHTHAAGVSVMHSASFHACYQLCELDDDGDGDDDDDDTVDDGKGKGPARVAYWAYAVPAPSSAPDRAAAATRNCQTWAVEVLRHLYDEGIISAEWVNKIERMVTEGRGMMGDGR